mmetsp:Transcript_32374/g.89267  ORF Transcript_32374/g.89267 Transcript_32374/m.89267 type:complete len:253 (+) Transcript_32374:269-1027(+)
MGSTPTSFKAWAASRSCRIIMNSSLEMYSLQSSSSRDSTCCNFSVTAFTTMPSFSASETALTTSQSTPISMFITVSAERTMKTKYSTKQKKLLSSRVSHMKARLSRNTPWISSEKKEVPTVSKWVSPAGVPMASCVKAMANMYMTTSKRNMTVNTERMPATMPLTRIISSGIILMRRAIRVSLSSLKSRRMVTFPSTPRAPAPPKAAMIAVMSQVSMTIMKTSAESKTNQASRRQSRLYLNALKRTNHSKEK